MKVLANKNVFHNGVEYKKGAEVKDGQHQKELVKMGHADEHPEEGVHGEGGGDLGAGEGQGDEGAEGGQGDDVEGDQADGEGQGDEGAEGSGQKPAKPAKPAKPKQPAKK